MANNSFNIVGLDFTEAKESLKEFLKSQDTLKDYNFDGSVLNTVLDVLAYNTHYHAFYANMVANEMFLDSAVLRPSVASHAKALGYVPTSRRAAKAVLDLVSVNAISEGSYLSRGTEFTGIDGNGTQYSFVLLDTVYSTVSQNAFRGLSVYEGTLRRMSYVYDPKRKQSSVLLIPNDKIDTSTIRVRVKASVTDNTGLEQSWTYADSYIDLTPESRVYFLQEKEAGMYELFFGDGFLGKQPDAANVVVVEYLETTGDAANGITQFTTTVANSSVTVVSPSSGGALEESSSRIKFLAPRFYQSQNRAVTEDDYTALVMKEYPNADSVYVYGGETITPPQYGKVFIAIKPKSGTALTTDEKKTLVSRLRRRRSVVAIVPDIVDPDYIDVMIDSIVTYNPSLTSLGEGTLKALVTAYIFSYSAASLENFGSNLYLSKIIQGINGLNGAIVSNETTMKLRKTVNLSRLLSTKGFSVDFKNSLYHPHDGHSQSIISTTTFSHRDIFGAVVSNVYGVDDGRGKINLVTTDSSGRLRVVYPNAGSVHYSTGLVNFNTTFQPITTNQLFTITVQPSSTDVYVFENKIFRVSRGYSDSVKIIMQTDTTRRQASSVKTSMSV
jgi:hypothetical protein